MSSSQSDLKKQNEEERRRKAAIEEEQRLAMARQQQPPQAQPVSSEDVADDEEAQAQAQQQPVAFKTSNPGTSDWQKICEAYTERYKKPVSDDGLEFASREEAVNFFKEQASATPPRKFFGQEIENGKLTGYNVFSCGDGQLYHGSLADIQTQLNEALKAKPDDANIKQGLSDINARMARSKTQDYKEKVGEKKAPGADEPEVAQSSTPSSPLATTPRPK